MQLNLDRTGLRAGSQTHLYPMSLAPAPGAMTAGGHPGGQDLAHADHGRAGPAHRGPRAGRRRGRHGRTGQAAQRGDGVPAVHQLSVDDGVRQHRLAAQAARREQHRRQGHGDGGGCISIIWSSVILPSCPAASSNAARALVKNAPLILLDEPLVNLDYKLREELRDELSAFAQGRSTVIYATTEPGEALLLGGYTAVLDEGRLLQYGPTAEVFHRPSSIRVARAFSDPPMNLSRGGRAASSCRAGARGAAPAREPATSRRPARRRARRA